MNRMRSLWVAFAVLTVSITAVFIDAASGAPDTSPVLPMENVQDTNTSTKLGYPFTAGQYGHTNTLAQKKNSATVAAASDLLNALSTDVTYVDSVQAGDSIYKVITVSDDAGVTAFGSAVLFTKSADRGKSWSDFVTLDPSQIASMAAGGPNRTTQAVTHNAVSNDIVADARIARAGNTTYVAFLSTAMQIGGATRGAPSGYVTNSNVSPARYKGTTRKVFAGETFSEPDSDEAGKTLDLFMHVFVTASTDDGANWSTPQMIPVAYDRFMNSWLKSGYNNATAGADNTREAVVTYDSALPGSLELVALGDGASVDRVYLAWLDGAVGEANAAGLTTYVNQAPKPIFAVCTFDNTGAAAGVANPLYYFASGFAFQGNRINNAGDDYTFDSLSGRGTAVTTWDKIQLIGLANPTHGFHGDGTHGGTGSVSWDKVWLVGHYRSAAAGADSQRVVAGTFDNVITFTGRGGGLAGLAPGFGSYTTLDHTGATNTATNTAGSEEFNFAATVNGAFDTATLYVFLTSNHPANDLLIDTQGTGSGTGDDNTAPNTMYVINLLDPTSNGFGGTEITSEVSFDYTMGSLGIVTYSNPHIAVVGNGTASNASVSDDLVILGFEASGITMDKIAGWADTRTNGSRTTEQTYLTIDNVYVIANLHSGASHFTGNDGSKGFNNSYAGRVDGYQAGTAYLSSLSNTSHSATRDSVSEDATLLDVRAFKYQNNATEQRWFVGVTFRSNTPGGAKTAITKDRTYPLTGTARTENNNDDLYFACASLTDDERKGGLYDLGAILVSNEALTATSTGFLYKKLWITGDAVVHARSRNVLNRNFVEVHTCYLTNARKFNNVSAGPGYETAFANTGTNNNMRAFVKVFEVGELLDLLRDSSDGTCLIGRHDGAQERR